MQFWEIHQKTPGAISFDPDEVWRIERAKFMLLTGQDAALYPYQLVYDVIELDAAERRIDVWRLKRR